MIDHFNFYLQAQSQERKSTDILQFKPELKFVRDLFKDIFDARKQMKYLPSYVTEWLMVVNVEPSPPNLNHTWTT